MGLKRIYQMPFKAFRNGFTLSVALYKYFGKSFRGNNRNVRTSCPYCEEDNPKSRVCSWSPEFGIAHCFKCEKVFDALQLVSDMEGVGLVQAGEILKSWGGKERYES
jgi:hypothetical protein